MIEPEATEREHRKWAEALRGSRKHAPFLAHVLENSPHPFAAFYPDGRLMTYNAAYGKMTGYAREELRQMVGSRDLIPEEWEGVLSECEKKIGPEREPLRLEKAYFRKDGSSVDVEILFHPVYDTGGDLQYYYMFFDSVEERRRLEEKLQEVSHELTEAREALDETTRALGQHIQAPLRAIRNYADFLREDLGPGLNGDQKSFLGGLDRAVQEARELVEDLLEWSGIGPGRGALGTVDTGRFLRELVDSFHLPSDVDIAMGDDWPLLKTDPAMLRSIFKNLIANAVKFNTSRRKLVEIGWLKAEEGGTEFFVRDNGIGIRPRYQGQIFGIFERLHAREEYPGTGMGLAVARKAAHSLGGEIRLESRPGEGSTFFVTLPGKPDKGEQK